MSGDRTHVFKLFGTWEFLQKPDRSGGLPAGPERPALGSPGPAIITATTTPTSNRPGSQPPEDLDEPRSPAVLHDPARRRFQGIIEARVMNVFDTQTVMTIDVRPDQPTFMNATSYASPRKFALTFYVNF